MITSQEAMSASLLLNQIREQPDGTEIKLPVRVNFDRTAQELYVSALKTLLRSKSPKAVTLYKWPETSSIDEASLASIYEMLIDARVKLIQLDVRNLSDPMVEDLYQKTKIVLSQTTARPAMIAYTMYNADFWAARFLKLVGLPGPIAQPEFISPPRPMSAPPEQVSVTSHSIFAVDPANKLSASAHAGSLHAGQSLQVNVPVPSIFDDLEPPPGIMIEKPREPEAESWGASCNVM